jgi:hypothetical protein
MEKMQDVIVQLGMIIILACAIVAIYKWRKVHQDYYPLFIYVFICVFFSLVQYIFVNLVSNVFVLAEGISLLFVFKSWNYLDRYPKVYRVIIGLFAIVWIIEFAISGKYDHVLLYYRILYSFVLVILSVNAMNFEIVHFKGNLLKYPQFLILIAFILYFTYNVMLESFYIAGIKGSFEIKRIINIVSKSIILIAILWIPSKMKTLDY